MLWRFPATIEVLQDVTVNTGLMGDFKRGVLQAAPLPWRRMPPFTLRRGERFQMLRVEDEGGCIVRIRHHTYDVSSCYWVSGFADAQADIFKVVSGRRWVK